MKPNKLYFVLISFLLMLVLLMAGCSSAETNSESTTGDGEQSSDSGEKITVEVFQGKVEIHEQYESLAELYEESNPNVDIKIKTLGGSTDYTSSLLTEFSSGEQPEIFNVNQANVDQFKEYLADLSGTEAAEAALDGTLSDMSEGNTVYGLPQNQEGYGFAYNKNVFEKAGIDPEQILSYEDLEAAVKKLDSQKEELGLDAVFALGAKETWIIGRHLANIFLAPEFENDPIKAASAETVTFERGEEMKRMLDLMNEYGIQPSLNVDFSQEVEQYFSLQKVAMVLEGNWIYPVVKEMDPEFAENGIGILPVPLEGYEGKGVAAGIPTYWAVNGNEDEEVVQASKDFLDWLYTSEVGKEAVLNQLNFIPAYSGYDTSEIADPLSKEIYEYSSEGNTIGWVFSGYPTSWGVEVLGPNMQKYIAGQMTWDELEADSIAEWEEARNE